MWNMLWPILIVVGSNTVYNICAKSTPGEVNPFVSLSVTYLVATVVSAAMFFITGGRDLIGELTHNNWTAPALGLAIVALEFGYICIYRAGWQLGSATLVANISLAVILLFVGAMLYREVISLRQIAGIAVCAAGLWLIAR